MQELALSSGRNLLRPSLRETPLRTPFWDSLSTRVFCILIRTHPSRATRRTGRPRWILEEKFSGKSISVDTLLKCLSPEYRANFLFFLFRYESSLRITWVIQSPTVNHVPSPTPGPTQKPTPTPTPKPTSAPTHQPAPTQPPHTPTPCPGINCNPWGYNFSSPGKLIYVPPSGFCNYFNCIPTFYESDDPGDGYIVQCSDGMYSLSGGERV